MWVVSSVEETQRRIGGSAGRTGSELAEPVDERVDREGLPSLPLVPAVAPPTLMTVAGEEGPGE